MKLLHFFKRTKKNIENNKNDKNNKNNKKKVDLDDYLSLTQLYAGDKLPKYLRHDTEFVKYFIKTSARLLKRIEQYASYINYYGWRDEFASHQINNIPVPILILNQCILSNYDNMYVDAFKSMTLITRNIMNQKFYTNMGNMTLFTYACWNNIAIPLLQYCMSVTSKYNETTICGLSSPMLLFLTHKINKHTKKYIKSALNLLKPYINIALVTTQEYNHEFTYYTNGMLGSESITVTVPSGSTIFDIVNITKRVYGMSNYDVDKISKILLGH
jgi:hypothetical protein